MSDKSLLERVAGSIALVSIAVAVTGTKACQEDYEVGGQTTITPVSDATNTPNGTLIPNGTGTVTATPSGSQTPQAGGTPTATPTDDVSTDGIEAGDDAGLFEELSALGQRGEEPSSTAGGSGGAVSKDGGNWLGKAFDRSQWEDNDGDGFANVREESSQSDPGDANSVPTDVERGQLDLRIRQLDEDMDGVLNEDEAKRGTNPANSDSDGDGRTDGAEIASGGDPLDASVLYPDTDGDGLSNSFEENKGFNPSSNDSDGDGLRDDLELVVGSNPLKIDSDGDGISDGREYDLNSDPLLGEPDRAG